MFVYKQVVNSTSMIRSERRSLMRGASLTSAGVQMPENDINHMHALYKYIVVTISDYPIIATVRSKFLTHPTPPPHDAPRSALCGLPRWSGRPELLSVTKGSPRLGLRALAEPVVGGDRFCWGLAVFGSWDEGRFGRRVWVLSPNGGSCDTEQVGCCESFGSELVLRQHQHLLQDSGVLFLRL